MNLSEVERKALKDILDNATMLYSQSNNNFVRLDNTPENKALAIAAAELAYTRSEEPDIKKETISRYTSSKRKWLEVPSWVLIDYLLTKI
jgi:hypothetical protein